MFRICEGGDLYSMMVMYRSNGRLTIWDGKRKRDCSVWKWICPKALVQSCLTNAAVWIIQVKIMAAKERKPQIVQRQNFEWRRIEKSESRNRREKAKDQMVGKKALVQQTVPQTHGRRKTVSECEHLYQPQEDAGGFNLLLLQAARDQLRWGTTKKRTEKEE